MASLSDLKMEVSVLVYIGTKTGLFTVATEDAEEIRFLWEQLNAEELYENITFRQLC